jgi:hypothetical protein
MPLEAPIVDVLKEHPQGADTVAVFLSANLELTYWDLWCLLSAKHCFNASLIDLRKSLVERRLQSRSCGMSQSELLGDLFDLLDDLLARVESAHTSVDEILQHLSESLLKKEIKKGIDNITSNLGYCYPPSEPMVRSPRRLLEREAMRGMWGQLSVDPTASAENRLSRKIAKSHSPCRNSRTGTQETGYSRNIPPIYFVEHNSRSDYTHALTTKLS